MNAPPKLDGRLEAHLEAELKRTAIALRGENAGAMPVGEIERAIYAVAARIGEEVTTRLDKAPDKQVDNFYEAAGLGRDAARAATLPVAYKLTETSVQSLSAPAGTQLLADAGEPVIFETQTRIDLVPGRIEAIRGVDAEKDAVTMSPTATLNPILPVEAPLPRRLKALVGTGDVKMQLNPASGLKEGALLAFGSGTQARHHRVIKVEGEVITVAPPLETAFPENTPVSEVVCFAPFHASTRDYQQHNLYLAHSTLLDTPSAVSLRIGGAPLPQGAEWQWWGSEGGDAPAAWHQLKPQPGGDDFTKPKGKPQKTKINGQESFWIRASLNGKSNGTERAENVTLSIVGEDCKTARQKSGPCVIKNPVEYDAVAANIPAVVNKPFHPFGREPRLYDTFYVGSKEAFPKIGAKVAMDFAFGGASLGPMAAVADGQALELYGVGTDGLLYRARVSGTSGTLLPVPREEAATLAAKAPVAVMTIGRTVHVAVAGSGKIEVATLDLGGLLTPDRVQWKSYSAEVTAASDTWLLVPQIRESKPGFVLFADNRLFRCALDGDSAEPIEIGLDPLDPDSVSLPVLALAAIKNTNSLIVVTQRASDDPEPLFHRLGSGPSDDATYDLAAPETIPLERLAAWSKADLAEPIYLAGTDGFGLKIHRIGSNGDSVTELFRDDDSDPGSLVFVSSMQTPNARPSLLMTAPGSDGRSEIQWLVPSGSNYASVADKGGGADLAAEVTLVAVEGWIAAQHDDVGILARALADPTGLERLNFNVPFHAIMLPERDSLPAKIFAVGDNNTAGQPTFYAFEEEQNGKPARLAKRLPISELDSLGIAITNLPDHFAEDLKPLVFKDNENCDIDKHSAHWRIRLANGDFLTWDDLDNRKYLWEPYSVAGTGSDDAIFLLEPKSGGSDQDRWKIPDNFSLSTAPQTNRLLKIATAQPYRLFDAVQLDPADTNLYAQKRAQRTLRPLREPDYVMQDRISHDGTAWLLAPEGSIVKLGTSSHQLQLTIDPPSWLRIGPDAPANPALSWEYWNGSAWWALGTDEFSDGTGHFQTNGCVRFTVPPDIKPTEVSGKPGHWIRSRLVGGDYGEAKFSVITTSDGSGGTKQETKRDTSVIRAPYIVKLDIGYCASDPVLPEIIYAEDSLSYVDQTSANEAGLPFEFFVPLSKAMNPPDIEREATEKAAREGECDDPCPDEKAAEPDPCDEPGAYDRCDSPCVWMPGDPRPKTEAASGFVRGVMIGFDKRFSGNTVSIYVMAEPTGSPVNLRAAIYADGRFRPVQVVSDSSYGLTEPGLLTLALPKAADESNLLGETSHWLRLWPEGDSSAWSPLICGLFLNGALTRSVETRSMERLGASNGTAGQVFQLAETPVDPESLVLRVREILGQQEREGLDIKSYPNGPPGEWVLWQAANDFSDDGEPSRTFTLDAHGGKLRFGDGDNGLIPPLGAELIAERYARVKGSVANKVKAGTKPTLLASLAGVDSVLALDYAAGGSDTEAAPQARHRASAKLRHGNRILTVADLADFVPTLAPDIAQVRVIASARKTRIVVALTGPDPRPMPAKLRGIERNIKSVCGYGLRRPDGLEVVGPRILPLGLAIDLVPLSADSFADAAIEAGRYIMAFFDAATGGHDGRGWPMGRLPEAQDIAAALMPIATLAFPAAITLRRADRAAGVKDELPSSIPMDVLVRLDAAGLLFERAVEVAA